MTCIMVLLLASSELSANTFFTLIIIYLHCKLWLVCSPHEKANILEKDQLIYFFFTLLVSLRGRWINKGMLKLFFTPGLRIKFLEYRDLLWHSFSRYILCLGIWLDVHPRSKIIFSPLRMPFSYKFCSTRHIVDLIPI